MPMALYFLYSIGMLDDSKRWFELLFYPVLAFVAYLEIVAAIRRFHDMDKSGAYIFVLLIPIIGIGGGWLLMFKKGTEGPNQYGPDPRDPEQIGITE